MSARGHILMTGVEFTNQGAYLMMRAIIREITDRFGAVPALDYRVGTAQQREGVGAATYVPVRLERLAAAPLIGQLAARTVNLIGPSDLVAVFDGSGYRYGDAWRNLDLSASMRRYQRLTRLDIPLYLLPQALGPFEFTSDVASALRRSARLIFARDPESEAAIGSGARQTEAKRIRVSPDFTGALPGTPVAGISGSLGDVPIVPNWNIAERAGGSHGSEAYVQSLAKLVDSLRSEGLSPYGLSHEGRRDADILREVSRVSESGDLHIVEGLDGLQLKWVIGQASAVVSGRYHAIASALSQGVPVVAHGWSHKYLWLMRDHGCEHQLVDTFADTQTQLAAVLSAVSSGTTEIVSGAERYKAANRAMWDAIRSDLHPARCHT